MIDVACVGTVYLDLTFEGLDELPGPGQERFARELHATPGGMAITAVGLVRLGASTALVAPVGRDLAGSFVRKQLEAEGILLAGPEVERTAVTVVVPHGEDRAMTTFEPDTALGREALERLEPRAVITRIDALGLVPNGAPAYVVLGDQQADRFARSLPAALAGARALIANRSEALRLTGEATADGAALALAESVETAVVTCGREGAVAACGGELVVVPAPEIPVRDSTGAGDLLTAAYVWGDLEGRPLAERLRRAVVYAALSVRTATGAGSAPTLDELERALAGAIVQESTAKEHS